MSVTNLPTAPPAEGNTPESRAAVLEALSTMNDMAEKAAQAAAAGTATMRTIQDGQVIEGDGKAAEFTDEQRQAILRKVGAFLDTKLQGPRFIGTARGKLFIGEYPRRQDLLDVQIHAGNRPGEMPSAGQFNLATIDELRSVLFGWVPVKSPMAQLVRAHIDKSPEEMKKAGITLNAIQWLESRDPYIMQAEIDPLWEQYQKWKTEVEPTREEIDFYYSLMQ